jgi:hypothetical protein
MCKKHSARGREGRSGGRGRRSPPGICIYPDWDIVGTTGIGKAFTPGPAGEIAAIRRSLLLFAITTRDVLTEGLGTPHAPDTLDHKRQGVGVAIPGRGDRDVLAVLQRRGHQRPRAGVGAELGPDGRQDELQLLEGFLCGAL